MTAAVSILSSEDVLVHPKIHTPRILIEQLHGIHIREPFCLIKLFCRYSSVSAPLIEDQASPISLRSFSALTILTLSANSFEAVLRSSTGG